jgi:hypothetical protein
MSRYTYTVSADNAVSIFDTDNMNEDGSPNIFQPIKPVGGAPFASSEEAREWAEQTIYELLNPIPYIPPVTEVIEETPAES